MKGRERNLRLRSFATSYVSAFLNDGSQADGMLGDEHAEVQYLHSRFHISGAAEPSKPFSVTAI
jgi:hypothetical protein